MENEQYTDELEVVTQDEQLEDVVEETTDQGDTSDDDVDSEAAEFAKARAEAAKYRRLYEKEIKHKTKPKAQSQAPQTASSTSVEETVLLANGMPEELLEKLKKVAQVQEISLLKAKNDPIFLAVQESFEKAKRSEQASIGSSRSSGTVKPKKDFNTPGLSAQEHRELFNKTIN